MKPLSPSNARPTLLAAMMAVVALSGCALDRLPRIDPSGERFLVFPGSQPVVGPVATPGSTPVVVSPNQPIIAQPQGNLTVPPALPAGGTNNGSLCPISPLCPLGGLFEDRKVIGPVATGPIPEPPTDRVTLTPARVLAPVGTEVVLKAGVCGKDGYFLTNRRIEWMLGQEGAGQFAEIGQEGELDMGRLPWSRPEKIDNHYAVGYTNPFYVCLHRGTNNPADDLQVQKGEAWVSVTSASEGTSYITAYAPGVENWNARRAQATIYWVDAQWQLPPSAVVAAGQPHTLTTTVTRQSDGAPIAGWIVKYEVADGSGAQLGYQAGQAAEATTDNRGRASIEVTPTDANPGTTQVRITVVRPEQAGVAASPRIDVGSGMAQITWSSSAPGTQPLFPPVGPPPTEPTPRPTLPGGPPVGPREPPIGIQEPPAGRPDLRIRVERATQGEIKARGRVVYNVVLENLGNGVARNVQFKVRYDDGLINPQDTQGIREITLNNIGDLQANGGSLDADLEFDVLTAGPHYFDATLTADGADAFEHVEFTATEDRPPAPKVQLRSSLSKFRAEVGQIVRFRATIENSGSTPAEDLVFTVYGDPQLEIDQGTEGSEPMTDGGFRFDVEPIPPGQKRVLEYDFECKQATEVGRKAEVRAFVRSASGVNLGDSQSLEITPALNPGAGAGPLSIDVSSNNNPARLNGRSNVVVTVRNTGQQVLQGVRVRITMPNGVIALPNLATTPVGTGLVNQAGVLELSPPIAQLAPNAQEQITLPYDAVQRGEHTISVSGAWLGSAAWVTDTEVVTVTP